MSYTPHEWQDEEIITAERLNAIEQGIVAGGNALDILVNITSSSYDNTNQLYRIDDIELYRYDHNSIVNKIISGEPIFGYAYSIYPYHSKIDGCSEYTNIIPLTNVYLGTNISNNDPATSDPQDITCTFTFRNLCASNPNTTTGNFTSIVVDILSFSVSLVYNEEENDFVPEYEIYTGIMRKIKTLS